MEQRFETFTVLIGRISRCIKRLKAEQMELLDLKGPHVSCLYYLYRFGPMTAAELCDRCEEDKAAISRSLEYLENSGYLSCKITGPKKYRSSLVLTEKGQTAGAEVARRIEGIVEAASANLNEEERLAMYHALEAICENLEKLCQNQNQRRKTK